MKINCIEISDDLLRCAKEVVDELDNVPTVNIIQVGNNPASNVYVRNKIRKLTQVGITPNHVKLDENATENDVYDVIEKFNYDDSVGTILQLPTGFDKEVEDKLLNSILTSKDIDCLSSSSKIYNYLSNNVFFLPCTSNAVVTVICYWLIKEYERMDIDMSGITVDLYGRSDLVNKPLITYLLDKNATVRTIHSKSPTIEHLSEVVVSALPLRGYFKASELVKSGVKLFVDVTITKENGKIYGSLDMDMDEEEFSKYVDYTPVPNGVGQLTTSVLAFKAARLAVEREHDSRKEIEENPVDYQTLN